MKPHRPPESMTRTCLRGISQRLYLGLSDVPARANEFADRVAVHRAGVTKADAATALEAHERIDELVVRHGGWTDTARVCRMLWGGDDARGWLQQVVESPEPAALPEPAGLDPEPEPVVPVAARLDNGVLKELAELSRLMSVEDDRLQAQLDAVVSEAYKRILGSLTVQAQLKLRRIPKRVRETDGWCMDERDRILAAVNAAPKLDGWRFMPEPVAAALSIDQEERIEEQLADLETEIESVFDGFFGRLVDTLTGRLGLSAAAIIAGVGVSLEQRPKNAAESLIASLKAFLFGRLENRTATENRTNLPTEYVDPNIVRRGLEAATVVEGRHRPASKLLSDLLGDVLRFQTVETGVGYTWFYGSRASRHVPYEPHYAVDGRKWVEGSPGPDGQEISDHVGCQCIADETVLYRQNGVWFDPATGEKWV